MAEVRIQKLKKSFGPVEVLKDIDLVVEDGSFVVLVGPSGCGKSTLLRSIAGLEPVSSGTMTIGGRQVNDLPPAKREIAMVFQSYALYPHMNVAANMGFGLRFAGTPRAEIDARVNEAARILQLEPLLKRKPRELSGGQRQRVAIGRAIVRKPQVFLFDEPLSNLDAALRINTRVEIAKLHKLLKATIVYVTHDQVEAMTLADKIVVMNSGRIEQQGKPLDLYYKPANLFVAGFIGSPAMNFLSGTVGDGCLDLGAAGKLALPSRSSVRSGDRLTLGVRPEHLRLGGSGGLVLNATVDLIERLGETGFAHLRLATGHVVIAEVRGEPSFRTGDNAIISLDPEQVHLFGADGNRLA
ncbi:ABC transporter ATP-binding protein [Aestuariivirga sp.]|uniref:ABC transporter ATP-binding protein n=1 Tax=Aestuariivirga sp. TaxID=2650926 RepID=UPI003594740A